MCGIAALIHLKKQPVSPSLIEDMTRLVTHRGPDGEGFFFDKHMALGHRRLSIIDLSEQATQPMTAYHTTLIFNGEIYNYIEIKTELEQKGYVFTTKSDTEVILAAYHRWGESCVERFNGMWAFVLYDSLKKKLFASRDRFGEKPLYYASIGDYFGIASEIKQFTVLPQWVAQLNPSVLGNFFHKNIAHHSDNTFFQNVQQLKAGENLIVNTDTYHFYTKKYYTLVENVSQLATSLPSYSSIVEAKESLFTLFQEAVALRLRSDVAVGTSLSGGLDSSSIAVLMHHILSKQNIYSTQKSVTASYPQHPFDETPYAQAVGEKAQLDMYFTQPDADSFLESMDNFVWHQDEPISTDSAFAQYMVFQEAHKQGLKVMLDGQGADEILGGYGGFYRPFLSELLKKNPLHWGIEVGFYARYQGLNPILSLLKKKKMPLFVKEKEASDTPSVLETKNLTAFQRMSLQQVLYTSLPTLLHFADRNAMAHSVEARLPFLDYRLVEFCIALPDAFKIHYSRRKFILREIMRPYLPHKVVNRHDKIGFFNPGETWMQANPTFWYNEMAEIVNEWTALFDPIMLSDFDSFLHKKRHLFPEAVYWQVLFFGKWAKRFKVML